MKTVIARLQKQFPQVTKVVEATKSIRISVTLKDSASARKKDPNQCALAKACVRNYHLDGAVIGIAYSYLIKGNVATRYKTSVAVGREITSFDRHHDFAEGKDYLLAAVSPHSTLKAMRDHREQYGSYVHPHKAKEETHKHFTSNIRVMETK